MQRFEYDAENHQKAFFNALNSGSEPDATYHYDGEGRRVKKISSTETTLFVYDGGGQLVAEYSTELAVTQQVSYLTQDHLGSPRVITNESGTVTSRKDFTAFGEENVTAARSTGLGYDPASTRKSYTGYEKDEESQLEFAQARYYNPTHGRFTSVDPMIASATIKNPQTFNRYSYVLNSPYKLVDPLGLIATGMNNGTGCSAQFSSCTDDWDPGSDVEQQQTQPPPKKPKKSVSKPKKKAKQKAKKPEPPPDPSSTTSQSQGPVVVVNGNPLQRTASGGLSILLDKDAAKAISLMTSSAIELNFEIAADTTITLDLLDDGGFSVSASNPIKIDYTGPIDVRLSKVTFDGSGLVTSTEASYPIGPLDLNVSSAVRSKINNTIRTAIYGEGMGAVLDPIPQIVRRAAGTLYGRRVAPLNLDFRVQKKK